MLSIIGALTVFGMHYMDQQQLHCNNISIINNDDDWSHGQAIK